MVIRDIREMRQTAERMRLTGKRISVVPTMGYLHEGHLSLIRIAKKKSDVTITTLFVNPAQFGQNEDFSRYPRSFERDLSLAHAAGTDYLFAPETSQIYPTGYSTYVNVEGITDVLEGKSRPGHFRGVATVVTKLLNLTKPHIAVFGQKDAQQVAVIRRLVRDLNIDVEVLVVPIVREPDGLAMSSRNTYLNAEQRRQATVLYQALVLAEQRIKQGVRECSKIIDEMQSLITTNSSGQIDYISIADNNSLQELATLQLRQSVLVSLAVKFGTTRLIDNIVLLV
ncbi:MAG: pantoate--beta-alanine ligase [Bacteroidetes bacterium]|nr:pantoate--beta-alanine ligase [Bacteroidota bacterium]MCW5894210.1 pantoate--beta-alanine ligase [Bacteroidota bacterium]